MNVCLHFFNCILKCQNMYLQIDMLGRSLSHPRAKIGSSKYGKKGLYTRDSFQKTGLSWQLCEQLAFCANHSLSQSTWSAYKTVKGHMEKCQYQMNIRFNFPMSNDHVICFISWLLKRGLKAKTIDTYIRSINNISHQRF